MQGRRDLALIVAALLFFAACGTEQDSGVRRAEVLDEPFPATVMNLHIARLHTCGPQGCRVVKDRECNTDGCVIAMTVRVTNPTDRDANVTRCVATVVLDGSGRRRAEFWMQGPAGAWVDGGQTREVKNEIVVLPLSYTQISQLPPAVSATCEGWDWHGNPPD